MDQLGIALAILLVAGGIAIFLQALTRSSGEDKNLGFVCAGSLTGLGIMKLLLRTGRMEDGTIYGALEIALLILFFGTMLWGLAKTRRNKTAR